MSQTGSAAWGSEMKTKRRIIDTAMVLLLPLLMAYSLIGEAFHEVAGTLMLVLFLLHHWMNRAWWKNLFKGRYSPQRVFQTVKINAALARVLCDKPLGQLCSCVAENLRTDNGEDSRTYRKDKDEEDRNHVRLHVQHELDDRSLEVLCFFTSNHTRLCTHAGLVYFLSWCTHASSSSLSWEWAIS